MTLTSMLSRTTAVAALVALPLAPMAANADDKADTTAEGTASQTETQATEGTQPAGEAAGAAMQADAADQLIAKVGDAEIMRSDVLTAIGALPAQLQEQPPEMLIPLAVDQLVLRELILAKAREQGLDEDSEVQSMVQSETGSAQENAMVQVWLQRELDKSVSDETVASTYEQMKASVNPDLPPLELVRPQIEQQLRQMAFQNVREELQADANVTFFGPDGQELEMPATQ